MVCVECLVVIQKIIFNHKATVDVAVFEINGLLFFLVDVPDLLASGLSQCCLVDQKLSTTQNYLTPMEGTSAAWLHVQCSRQSDAATTADATHMIELWTCFTATDFPLLGELADYSFELFISIELLKISLSN
jgi:hypothetical protein